MPLKNSGGSTKFPGGHKVIHRTAQTAFVRVVTPRGESREVTREQHAKGNAGAIALPSARTFSRGSFRSPRYGEHALRLD